MATRLRIRGRVQGVGYRASLAREAQRLGLRGWVRNRIDGSVEALVDGDAAIVQRLLDWANVGPPAARVDGVEIAVEAGALEVGFRVLATA